MSKKENDDEWIKDIEPMWEDIEPKWKDDEKEKKRKTKVKRIYIPQVWIDGTWYIVS